MEIYPFLPFRKALSHSFRWQGHDLVEMKRVGVGQWVSLKSPYMSPIILALTAIFKLWRFTLTLLTVPSVGYK